MDRKFLFKKGIKICMYFLEENLLKYVLVALFRQDFNDSHCIWFYCFYYKVLLNISRFFVFARNLSINYNNNNNNNLSLSDNWLTMPKLLCFLPTENCFMLLVCDFFFFFIQIFFFFVSKYIIMLDWLTD